MVILQRGDSRFGLVVDDKEAVRAALQEAGIEPLPGPFLDFLDPWGNRIEIIGYENIQFTKASNVLRGMGLSSLNKTDKAKKELAGGRLRLRALRHPAGCLDRRVRPLLVADGDAAGVKIMDGPGAGEGAPRDAAGPGADRRGAARRSAGRFAQYSGSGYP